MDALRSRLFESGRSQTALVPSDYDRGCDSGSSSYQSGGAPMILQALKEYYDRKSVDPAAEMAPLGFEWKQIPFIIDLKADGSPVSLECTTEGEGYQRHAKRCLVPEGVKRGKDIAANLLWDNPEYALGIVLKSKKIRVKAQHTE